MYIGIMFLIDKQRSFVWNNGEYIKCVDEKQESKPREKTEQISLFVAFPSLWQRS